MAVSEQQAVTDAITAALSDFHSFGRIVVAYSGGIDSHVLLHATAVALPESSINAIHINHQLQKESEQWQRHCQTVCRQLGVSLTTVKVDAHPKPGESPEAAARDARYSAIKNLLSHDDILLTAHHLDDQAETVLLQLLRGAGPSGLAGMPSARALGDGCQVRPFLTLTKKALRDYASVHALDFVEDPSNQSDRYQRNYLRNTVMPMIQSQWPAASKTIARSAANSADAAALVAVLAKQDAQGTIDSAGVVDLEELAALPVLRQKNTVRHWLQQQLGHFPSQRELQTIFDDIIAARADASPSIELSNATIYRYRGRLYLESTIASLPENWTIIWRDTEKDLLLSELGLVLPVTLLPANLSPKQRVSVRLRRGGESIKLSGRPRKSLKGLLQERGIPPWRRNRLPLVYVDEELVAVFGIDCKL